MREKLATTWLTIMLASICLSGCTLIEKEAETPPLSEETRTAAEHIGYDRAIWTSQGLALLSVLTKEIEYLPPLDAGYLPINRGFSTFQVTPQRKKVVWYTPEHGFLGMDLAGTGEIIRLYQPSPWFDINPYWYVDHNEESVYLMEDEGKTLQRVDLHTMAVEKTPIPFPYGNVFAISEDGQRLVFSSGFGHNEALATFLVTDGTGSLIDQFETNTPLSERFLMAFLDNERVVLSGFKSTIVVADVTQSPITTTTLPLPFERPIQGIFPHALGVLLTTDRSSVIYERATETFSHFLVEEVFAGLGSLVIYPYDSSHVIAVEHFNLDEKAWDRLWLVNLMGVKKLLVPEFNVRDMQTSLPVIP